MDMSCDPPEWCSPSSLDRYEQCPLAYWLLNIQRLPDAPGEAAVTGTFVHLVLEQLMALPPGDRTLESARSLAASSFGSFTAEPDFVQLDLDDAGVRAFKQRSWTFLQQYFELESPPDVDVQGLELWVRGRIADAPVRGIIDRLERDDGAVVITDYKTGKPPHPRYVRERFKAMTIYASLYESIHGVRPERLRLLYVAGPVEHSQEVDDKALSRCAERVSGTWQSITADCERGEFQPTPNRLCDWCAAKPYCPVWGGSLEQGVAIATQARTTTTT